MKTIRYMIFSFATLAVIPLLIAYTGCKKAPEEAVPAEIGEVEEEAAPPAEEPKPGEKVSADITLPSLEAIRTVMKNSNPDGILPGKAMADIVFPAVESDIPDIECEMQDLPEGFAFDSATMTLSLTGEKVPYSAMKPITVMLRCFDSNDPSNVSELSLILNDTDGGGLIDWLEYMSVPYISKNSGYILVTPDNISIYRALNGDNLRIPNGLMLAESTKADPGLNPQDPADDEGDLDGDGIKNHEDANPFIAESGVFSDKELYPPTQIPAIPGDPRGIEAVDVSGDNKRDLMVACYDGKIRMLQSGAGTNVYYDPYPFDTVANQLDIIAVHLDGDGKIDFAVATNQLWKSYVLWNNLDQNFSFGQAEIGTLGGSKSINTADFNNDGNADIVVAASYMMPGTGNYIHTYKGTGNKSPWATTADMKESSPEPFDTVSADFNNDGKIDLAVINYSGNNIYLFLGNGDGFFEEAVTLPSGGTGLVDLAVLDYNEDGILDLAAAHRVSADIQILLGDGLGGFTLDERIPTGTSDFGPRSISVADFDGNGMVDIAVAGYGGTYTGTRTLWIHLRNTDGTISTIEKLAGMDILEIIGVDLQNDNDLDLVAISTAGRVLVFRNRRE